jgi:uncharacterized ferritin-like protein (DUF455 family)
MELRALAEQILFATTLEEKLVSPECVSDECPGVARPAPAAPGRPRTLRFKAVGSGKGDFPSVHHLEHERERGELLHYFANHELLATELMALVLLRFPDAPAAFRKGVWQTLRDEQLHTRFYVERMQDCGVQFGELPVSGYFWRTISGMSSPLDYVAGLSLTFEQANLDFCRHFARLFREVGDEASSQLLERIYRDEIGHVAYGLKWFRRWKEPKLSDWDALCRQLKFPLSPSRAKAVGRVELNVEGRRAAGLTSGFIDELNVHGQSRGRTPNVFVFNPFVEAFIAQGSAFSPVRAQTLLAADLANLPQFLARQDDVVLVEKKPTTPFLSGLKQSGFALPEFMELRGGELEPDAELTRRRIGYLRPWGWGPDSLKLLRPLAAQGMEIDQRPWTHFESSLAELYSKAWSASFLGRVLKELEEKEAGWFCDLSEVGVAVETLARALDVIRAIRGRGHHRVVVKEALGAAGQNMLRLWEPELLETQRRWMTRALERGGVLIIEPWLERVLDFSVQWEMGRDGLRLCGYVGLENDRRGQFQANWAGPHHRRRLPGEVAAFFHESARASASFQRFYEHAGCLLENELSKRGFVGPLGVDAFVYRRPDGTCRLKPIVELNPRYTMGRVLVELMSRACPGRAGCFQLLSRKRARAEGYADFVAYSRALVERWPLQMDGEPLRKIREGVICLNDPTQAESCLAVFRVGPGPGPASGRSLVL